MYDDEVDSTDVEKKTCIVFMELRRFELVFSVIYPEFLVFAVKLANNLVFTISGENALRKSLIKSLNRLA